MTGCSVDKAIPRFDLASSAIRCRFVDRLVRLKVLSRDWDRNRARPAVGEGFPFPLFRFAGRVHNITMAYVSRSPPIMPDSQISRVRFETSAYLPWAFPRLGEV